MRCLILAVLSSILFVSVDDKTFDDFISNYKTKGSLDLKPASSKRACPPTKPSHIVSCLIFLNQVIECIVVN
jgi:hypothetical protein